MNLEGVWGQGIHWIGFLSGFLSWRLPYPLLRPPEVGADWCVTSLLLLSHLKPLLSLPEPAVFVLWESFASPLVFKKKIFFLKFRQTEAHSSRRQYIILQKLLLVLLFAIMWIFKLAECISLVMLTALYTHGKKKDKLFLFLLLFIWTWLKQHLNTDGTPTPLVLINKLKLKVVIPELQLAYFQMVFPEYFHAPVSADALMNTDNKGNTLPHYLNLPTQGVGI